MRTAPETDGFWKTRTHVCCDYLFAPHVTREFPVTKEQATNLTVGTITPHSVVSLQSLLTFRCFDVHLGCFLVLANSYHLVLPADLDRGLLRKVIVNDLAHFI